VEDDHVVHLTNSGRKYPVAINIDGEQKYVSKYDETLDLEIQKSANKVTLLIAQNHLQDWDNKVMQEQGFTI
jgi:hypothetical protein